MNPRKSALIALCVFALGTFGSGQSKGPGPGPGGSTRPPSANIPPSGATPPLPTPQLQQIIYNGRVQVAGPPLTDSAKVVARCGATQNTRAGIYSAFTDLKGNFSLTLGQGGNNAMLDASEDPMDSQMQSTRTMQVMSCDVTASATGYLTSRITVQFRSSLDSTEMGRLVLEPIGGSTDMGGVVSVTTLSAPEGAQHEYAKGIQELRDKKFDKAKGHFLKATEKYPKFAVAWEKLGKMQAAANDPLEARGSFQSAINADPKFVPPYLDLAEINAHESRWQDVADLTGKAVATDPQHFPEGFFLHGIALYNLGDYEGAEKSALSAERLDRDNSYPRVQLLLAEIFYRKGQGDAAAEHFRKFLAIDPGSSEAASVRSRLAKLEAPQQK